MKQAPENNSILGGYRVLDLADEKGLMCGMLLGDLGADVVKIEKPDGDDARNIGPFYHDEPHPEKSLYWFALNRNKKGITLDIETADGRKIFKQLVKTADFVIETFPPGHMAKLGLGYTDLEKLNPGIIMVSITDWGQDGPYVEKGYKADEMVLWALGGEMWLCGDIDRAPVQISCPQAYFHAGAEAAVAAMTAFYYRDISGEGQWADISIQECIPYLGMNTITFHEINDIVIPRGTMKMGLPRKDGDMAPVQMIWPVKDGYMAGFLLGGTLKAMSLGARALVEWMDEEGMAEDLMEVDWINQDSMDTPIETLQHQIDVTQRFLETKTKEEVYERAVKDKIVFAPITDPKDLATNRQLHSRNFFVDIEHPELGDTIAYCGPFVKFSETPMKRWFRAPLIGEHNVDIFEKELGFSKEQLAALKRNKTI
jgi:crotonobetainyl-CoA:carnitine CoA-transferase CaiB-like acyl-CoA transferase